MLIHFSIYNGHIVENVYNGNGITNEESHDYEKLIVKPVRPAPAVPGPSQMSFSSSYHGNYSRTLIFLH